MSEVLDRETQAYHRGIKEALAIALQLTETARIQSISELLPRGEKIIGYWKDNLFWEAHYLKPDYFLGLFYDKAQVNNPDPYTRKGLNYTDAWIFKYDNHYAKWTVEAWNAETGNLSFSRLAHRLATE
ncbi:hypothetical protein ES705_33459 [subsurface metagenome]